MTTRIRPTTAEDVAAIAVWIEAEYPLPASLGRSLSTILLRLLVDEMLHGVAVERIDRAGDRLRLAAFGLSAFLREDVATAYLASPVPYIELTLLDRVRRGERPFLGYEEIAARNAVGGLTLLPLMWLQCSNDRADPETQELLTTCQRSFLIQHRGYRLTRILKETPAERAGAFASGGFREVCRWLPGTPLPFGGVLAHERVVFEATRADFELSFPSAGAVGQLFPYRPPVCGFTRAEQMILSRALDHHTDLEIARQLALGEAAVAMRWRSIYSRIQALAPEVIGPKDDAETKVRGQEKRRRALAYVAANPAELRPYAKH